jgi:hypothetical protein
VKAFLHIAIAAAALGLAGAAAGAGTKPTLLIAVSGSGTVVSSPAGINCRPACKLHVPSGQKITLFASPDDGYEFSHWSAPCGTTYRCTVKMTGSRVVHAFFKVQPAAPQPPPPPPPPPPPAKPGNYSGTYSDGTFFKVFVDSLGAHAVDVYFDFNGHCSNGGTSWDTGFVMNGPFSVQSDGSFSGTATTTFSDSTVTASVNGKFTSSGSASGTLNIGIAFSDGTDCTSTGTWTAQDQN